MEIVKACLDWFPCAVSLLCSLEAESVIVEPFAFPALFSVLFSTLSQNWICYFLLFCLIKFTLWAETVNFSSTFPLISSLDAIPLSCKSNRSNSAFI